MRTMIEDDPSLRSSRDTRQALTVALVKPGRGSWAYQAKNSSRAMLYTRLVIGDETLSRTRAFIRRHSVPFSTTVKSFILHLLIGSSEAMNTLPSEEGVPQAQEPVAADQQSADGFEVSLRLRPIQTLPQRAILDVGFFARFAPSTSERPKRRLHRGDLHMVPRRDPQKPVEHLTGTAPWRWALASSLET
jgi:hypothetical protein